ncbi:MAG: hypothetical protein AAGE65_08145 [Planctomycetota bacterium]
MLNLSTTGVLGASVATLLAVAPSASAAVTYAGPFVGTTVTYTDVVESSGNPSEDPEPLYGVPSLVSGDLLDFDPTDAFIADAPPTDTTDGALSFTMTSNAGPLTTLIVSESGTFSFLGAENDELVSATLRVIVLDPLSDAVLTEQEVVFVEPFDTAPAEAGSWSNALTIDLTSFGVSAVDVVIDNVLQATGVGPAETFITKTNFQINAPEPAVAALLGGLGLAMLRRR